MLLVASQLADKDWVPKEGGDWGGANFCSHHYSGEVMITMRTFVVSWYYYFYRSYAQDQSPPLILQNKSIDES